MIQLKRVYEKPSRKDGLRILVDRLWPRGLTKDRAAVQLWLKDVAPSTELRKWFGHDPAKWKEFQVRYRKELREKKDTSELQSPKADGSWSWCSPSAATGFASSVRGWLPAARGKIMKKAAKAKRDRDMLAEYDFSQGVRGKYAQRYSQGTNIVVLSPDVAEFFPDSEAVNAALRALVEIARKSTKKAVI